MDLGCAFGSDSGADFGHGFLVRIWRGFCNWVSNFGTNFGGDSDLRSPVGSWLGAVEGTRLPGSTAHWFLVLASTAPSVWSSVSTVSETPTAGKEKAGPKSIQGDFQANSDVLVLVFTIGCN